MGLQIQESVLQLIYEHGKQAYPEEGAGLLLGSDDGDIRKISAILPLENAREENARNNRYLITPQEIMQGEDYAFSLGLDIVGIFHSHPDHPNRPSEYDREWALPWYSYLITSINQGEAVGSRSWRLLDDRSQFVEEELVVFDQR